MKKLLVLLLLFCFTFPAYAEEGDRNPILSIETGGHMGKIQDVIFTRDGRYLISASYDKTIRVWDVETGRIERVIRGQIGEGPEGKIFAAALSPDNRWLAVGGWMGPSVNYKSEELGIIRLIDFQTGQITRLLKGHKNVIFALSFSPDSSRLISGSGSWDKTARIWDVETGNCLHTLRGHTDAIYAVAFSPDGGQAVTGSYDDTLILWDARSGERIANMTGHGDNVFSVAFTPDGRYLLSGSYDKTIRLWDAKSGRFLKELARQDREVFSLSVSPDGKSVLAGSGGGSRKLACNVFSIPEGRKLVSFTKHTNIVLATAISPDGRIAATGGGNDKEIYLWDIRSGEIRQKLVGKGKRVCSVGFGAGGRTVAWGKPWKYPSLFGHGDLEQSFRLGGSGEGYRLGPGEALSGDTGYVRGVQTAGDISIRTPNNDVHPTLQILQNGRLRHEIKRGSSDGYDHRSLTLTPDGRIAVSGCLNGYLSTYDTTTGKKIRDFIGHTGTVWGVAVSPDGSRLVSGSDDQTVKIWDIATGKNLLTIFHGADNEWVAWTSEGYYDSSVSGDHYIGWHINRREDRSALYYPASQFAEKFRKPFIVSACLETGGNLEQALALAASRRPQKHAMEKPGDVDIARMLPPEVFFTNPRTHTETREDSVCIEAGARSLTDEAVTDIWLNGRRGIAVSAKGGPLKDLSGKTASLRQCFPLDAGENQIALFASTRNTRSQPEILRVKRISSPAENVVKPDLYVLAVGVSQYQKKDYNLKAAHRDAEAVSEAFASQKGKLYRNVEVRLLTDATATAGNILDGLEWILKSSTQKDVSVIFVAGHGENDAGNNYYFVPHDGDFGNLRRTCVKWFDFQDIISRLPSKSLMMVDTCRSGNITGSRRRGATDMTDAVRELIQASPGAIVMAASTGRESSIEDNAWGHGAFTKAIVEGLKEFRADYNKNGSIGIMELNSYVTERVKKLTDGRQHPTTEIPKIMPDFPIAVR
jgi:WD40 repeat protein